ncbi:MAG: hypothetical protein QGH43_01860 [Arenicellales bacterium]|nr:hypothetical protein [Arenicellales bacterium]
MFCPKRHRPEQTLRYRIVEEYCPAFTAQWAEQGRELPGYVQRELLRERLHEALANLPNVSNS